MFGEKLLGAAIRYYLWVPYVSKVVSQDKKTLPNFANFFLDRKILANSSCVIDIVSGTVRLDFSNCSTECSHPPKIWRNLARKFILATKPLTRMKPRDSVISPILDVFRQMWTVRLADFF